METLSQLRITVLRFLNFIFSGFFQWGSRAYHQYPEQTALDKTYNYQGKVIIIGAGASGLAAAKILERNNTDYQIIEATSRYGGRLKKDTTLADFPIDIGAEWIHNLPPVLNRLKGKKGDQVDEELIPYRLDEAYQWDGKRYRKVSALELDTLFEFMPESKFKNSTWYDFIDENFAKEVKHKIIFNAPVREIDYVGDKVQITTHNGDVFKADKVLLTVSIGVLRSNQIKFMPELNDEKKGGIASIDFLPGFKLLMKFKEKFYPDAIDCETETGEKVFYDVAFKKETQDHILGLLATGSSAETYYQLDSHEAIVSAALEELDQIFDGKASEAYTGKFILENWGQHEFTLGTWTQAFQSDESIVSILNQPCDKKMYFAGEIYDVHKQLGVPGAILSGYHSIDKLLTDNE